MSIVFLAGCKQDFKLTAPYKEEMVIYGLLNQQDNPTHYIRIEKGYLLQGNAYTAASITDSIYYPYQLKVFLVGPNVNVQLKQVIGSAVGQPESSGTFANNPNYLYTFNGNLQGGGTYLLTAIDTVSHDTVTAQTNTIGNFMVTAPQPGEKIALSNDNPFNVSFYSDTNAAIYDLTIRFYYNEYSVTSNALTNSTYIDIPAFRSVSANTEASSTNVPVTEDNVVNYLAQNIPVNTNVYRRFVSMDFNFSAGGTQLAKFLTTQAAQFNSLASSDALPPYTNIVGGQGLFSCRYNQSVTGVSLSTAGLDSLACGSDSGELLFKGSVNQTCSP